MAKYMKLLIFGILIFPIQNIAASGDDDVFVEELFIKPLQNGYVHSFFQFTVLWNKTFSGSSGSAQHYNLFPKAVGQIVEGFDVQELHLSLTQGLWRHNKWGYPIHSSPPGAQLWAWFEKSSKNVDESWTNLVNALSGLFCASLNFIDSTNTVQPSLSFRPAGVVSSSESTADDDFIRYATLPRENVCTENLTPWKKLLPCDSKVGISTLFNAVKLYNAHYHALTVDIQPVCQSYPDCSSSAIRLTQTISIVSRPAMSPGKREWTTRSLFERSLSGACPLASQSYVHVDISNESISSDFTITPSPSKVTTYKLGNGIQKKIASYDVAQMASRRSPLLVSFKWDQQTPYGNAKPPLLHAHRFIAGYGQENGGITCMLYNNHPTRPITVVYMDSVPWYARLYLHTLQIKTQDNEEIKPDILKFVPGRDRLRPYLLELLLRIPPSSVVTISIQFDRAFLKWTEYPPDANIGFYLGSAVISAMLPMSANYTSDSQELSLLSGFKSPSGPEHFIRIYTEPLLLQLPLPDFSMPYNVICLVCTVLAIAFGSVHNLTTRAFDFEPKKKTGILAGIKRFLPFVGGSTESNDTTTRDGDEEREKIAPGDGLPAEEDTVGVSGEEDTVGVSGEEKSGGSAGGISEGSEKSKKTD